MEREKINTGRQYNLDMLKALAIVAMILCHAVTTLSGARPDYESEFGYLFADIFLGSYLAVAHAFMFCMGVGFVYSRNNSPGYLMIRGVKTYILAYVLNFFRGGMYAIIGSFIDSAYSELIGYTMLVQDILHFAGLAMILTAFFKKIKLDCRIVLCIAVLMSVFAQLTAFKFNGNMFANILVGTFVPAGECGFESTFTLCGWYIFVAAGICFGNVLQRVKNLDGFYRTILRISSVVMFVYIAATVKYGCFFLSPGKQYYYAGTLEAIGLMSIDFVLMSLMYFGLKRLPDDRMKDSPFLNICWNMSRNINQIYFAQWCIIGLLAAMLVYLLEIPIPYWASYMAGVVIVILSYFAAKIVKERKNTDSIVC